MGKRTFISYSHQQADWVRQRLVPCFEAGGAEVLIDYKLFRAGRSVVGQMDATQDAADLSVLVLSPDYLASAPCQHEMQRAIARDPLFQQGLTIAVKRIDCTVPANLQQALWIDLRDDQVATEWDRLLQACEADLGASAPKWLEVRDEIVRNLQRGDSVNLVVPPRRPGCTKPKWHELITHIHKDYLPDLEVIDCELGLTTRKSLVDEILRVCGAPLTVPKEPEDLIILARTLMQRALPARLALLHFDIIADRCRRTPHFDADLFGTIRNLVSEQRKLILLVHSHAPYATLLPHNHPLSSITNLVTVELLGRS